MKERLDVLLVSRGLAPSREKAKTMIMEGNVFVNNNREDKAGSTFPDDCQIEIHGNTLKYVSRGGLKLEKAMTHFGIVLDGKVCMDIGASTGGFTDCMLQNGASKVYSVDVGYAAFVTAIRAMLLRDMGGCISPVHAFIFLQGLETLSLRVERHVENALKVVQYLNNHPQVERVHHPSVSTDPEQQALYKKYFPNGGGSIFTFEIKGGKETAKKFCDNLELFSLLANVADVKSLVIHPASTTHAQLSEEELNEQGIYSNTIRLSIGTENIDDIIEDLEGGFQSV